MSTLTCEDVLMLKMAEANGEQIEISNETKIHFERCGNCRREFEEIYGLDRLFNEQTRLEQHIDVWPLIGNSISSTHQKQITWWPFCVVAIILVGSKLFDVLPEHDPGFAIKIVPLLIAIILFVLIRENPFRLNSELTLER